MIDGVQAVFAVAATIAIAGLLVVLALREAPLSARRPQEKAPPQQTGGESRARSQPLTAA